MIDRQHNLQIARQAEILRISRGSVYYLPRPVSAADLEVMRRLDRLHLEYPFAGSRMLRGLLAAEGNKIGRRHVKTLMRRMGIEALYRRPRTTKPEPGQRPELDADQHGMKQHRFDLAQRRIGRHQGHEGEPHQAPGEGLERHWQIPDRDIAAAPIAAEAPDDQHEADGARQRI